MHCAYAHGQLSMPTVSSRYAYGHLTSQYANGQLSVRPRSARGTLTASSQYSHGQLAVRSRSAHSTPTVGSRYAHGTLTCQFLTATDPTNGRSHVTRARSDRGFSSKQHLAPEISGLCRISICLSFCTCIHVMEFHVGVRYDQMSVAILCHLCPLTACNIVSPVSTDSLQFCHLFPLTTCNFVMSPLTACNLVPPVSTDSLQYFITSLH